MTPELERAISILKDSPDFAAVLAGKTLREEVERLQEELAARIDTTEQKKELEQVKVRERQLREDLSQPNQNVLVPSMTSSGTGSEAERINKARHGLCTNDYHNKYIRELESANARLEERERQLNNRIQTDQLAYNHDIEVLESANARLQSENTNLKNVIAAPEQPRYAQLLGENARLREALTKLDEAVAREDMNRGSEVYLHRIIREALQPPKEQA